MLVDSLATRFRPNKLADVIGQKASVMRLKGIFKDKKVPKSIALIGPYGTGKTTLARIIARYVNCETNNACGKCENCLATNHPDVKELNAAVCRGIDEVRALIEEASYMPRLGKYRVFILDEVQQWTSQAASAMLKSMEEPPANCLFILCTMSPEKLDAAMLSRCNVFQLQRVSKDDVVEGLNRVLEKEKIKLPKEIVEKVAENSGGHMRSALNGLEAVMQIAAGLKDKDPKAMAKALAKGLAESAEVQDELVAMKILLSLYCGNPASLQKALLDANDYVSLINKLSYFNMYALEKTLVGEHKDIWNTAANKKFMDAVKQRQEEKKAPDGAEIITVFQEIQTALNTLREKMGSFMVNERALFTGDLLPLALRYRQKKK